MQIDLRSDTVTKPSRQMLEAMMQAQVGDDVFNEDPTVNELENYCASLFGKEAALYCPSGTMTNQIAINVHTRPGDEVICDINSHIYNYEGGGIAFNSGVQAKLLSGNEGRLSAEMIEPAINGDFDWLTRTALISLENTVNRAGGSYYTIDQIKPITKLCAEKKLPLHLDGARLFNALAETKEKPSEIGKHFDTISICLSKGLGAPVGSLLLGNTKFIKQARRVRKVLGGGMRQAGFVAAAGLYALQNNVGRLNEDHIRAKTLGQELAKLPFVESIMPVYTNIIIFNLNNKMFSGEQFEKEMRNKNIRLAAFGKQTIRFVTHLDFDDDMLDRTVNTLKTL
jgi:threonine aldolase